MLMMLHHWYGRLAVCGLLASLAAGLAVGCRSPQWHRNRADLVAYERIAKVQQDALGCTGRNPGPPQ